MSNWTLLSIDKSVHLIDLDSSVTKIPKFGTFPTAFLNDFELNQEFELFGRAAKLLYPNLSDFQANLTRGPQIISPKDIAWITYKSGLTSGDTVVEAGSGSGALTLALAQTIAPKGKVITFESNEKHSKIAKKNVDMSPWSSVVDFRNQELKNSTSFIRSSSIVLDLPNPWNLIPWCRESLEEGGTLICYVPTVNQVEKLFDSLDNWVQVEMTETIQRSWQSKKTALRPESNMLGHTGFIISARKINYQAQ